MTQREMARLLGQLTVLVPFFVAVLAVLLWLRNAGVIDEASAILLFALLVVVIS